MEETNIGKEQEIVFGEHKDTVKKRRYNIKSRFIEN